MPHFTYKRPTTQLSQGDILAKTEDIKRVLEKVHPHYLKEDYLYFIVLTQSCDLVRRKGDRCIAQYITLAAIRPLELLIARQIRKYQKDIIEIKGKFVARSKQNLLNNFITRLLNNNEPDYFYLHEDATMGFPESCVAFLRLSIALKASLHYENCLKAKKLELDDNFKAKLGWLVGNIYSRVGTDDWVPDYRDEGQFNKMIQEILNANCLWIDNIKEFLRQVRSKYTSEQIERMRETELQKLVQTIRIPTKKEQILNRLQELLHQDTTITDKSVVGKVIKRIKNDTTISGLLK
ncbi:MAG: hypothetical protein JSV30_06645 [Candidatus Omnitrophota bacterium]|nr:MAG: hypothetical protein JSV30_06645 [Candidatus Omnitrophota bacterium]